MVAFATLTAATTDLTALCTGAAVTPCGRASLCHPADAVGRRCCGRIRTVIAASRDGSEGKRA